MDIDVFFDGFLGQLHNQFTPLVAGHHRRNEAIILIVIPSTFLRTFRAKITLMSDNLEEKYLKALQLEKQIFGVPHYIVASTLNCLGAIYDEQQNG